MAYPKKNLFKQEGCTLLQVSRLVDSRIQKIKESKEKNKEEMIRTVLQMEAQCYLALGPYNILSTLIEQKLLKTPLKSEDVLGCLLNPEILPEEEVRSVKNQLHCDYQRMEIPLSERDVWKNYIKKGGANFFRDKEWPILWSAIHKEENSDDESEFKEYKKKGGLILITFTNEKVKKEVIKTFF